MSPTEQQRPFSKVVIVGAGPSGMLLAILLAQQGIPSVILEAWDRLDERLRATQYGVPATRIFHRAGIVDDIRAVSIPSFPNITWRRGADHEKLVSIDLSVVKDHPDRMTILALNQILIILYRHCTERFKDLIEIKFSHRVTGVGQDKAKAWVDVDVGEAEPKGKARFEADYVIGCDGATSAVRKALFGRNWPGQTFNCRLVVQNVYYDGFEKHGWDGGNYMVDPEHWGLVAKRANEGLWRVTYGEDETLTDEQCLERRPAHLKALLPGNPDPGAYRIEKTNIYRTHNRCAETFRVGRVLLAADAAHICNPWGGYGCMTACVDVGGLADCLIGYHQGKAPESILDLYSEIRREKFLKYVDVRSIKNMDRISKTDPFTVLETDKFMRLLADLEGDDEKTRAFLLVSTYSLNIFLFPLHGDLCH
ncbi:hypothetical protein N7535_008729 [Penicillium sp. DV-2018c]|nr:hypothetical protein N7535_008729 [Penicillium sp. DV-2018c]